MIAAKRYSNGKTNNLKMNDAIYKLRRQVIDYIYEAKEVVELPRITVRITDNHKTMLGCATLEKDILWITERAINEGWDLRSIVYHEIAHAVFGTKHDENCRLMKACQDPNDSSPSKRMSKLEAQTILKELVKS